MITVSFALWYNLSHLVAAKQGEISSDPAAVNDWFFAASFSTVNFYISSVF